jgi:hypothetical protein
MGVIQRRSLHIGGRVEADRDSYWLFPLCVDARYVLLPARLLSFVWLSVREKCYSVHSFEDLLPEWSKDQRTFFVCPSGFGVF